MPRSLLDKLKGHYVNVQTEILAEVDEQGATKFEEVQGYFLGYDSTNYYLGSYNEFTAEAVITTVIPIVKLQLMVLYTPPENISGEIN